MDKIFKIICIVMFLVGGGVGYLLTAFFYNEHDNFHGLISHFLWCDMLDYGYAYVCILDIIPKVNKL